MPTPYTPIGPVTAERIPATIRRVKVPFVDLATQYAAIRGEVLPAMEEVLESAAFVLGPHVAAFEQHFAAYIGARYCVGVESGTAALKLALAGLGIGPGDEVVLPANTYIASALAISAVGATPLLVDVDDAYGLDPNAFEAAITPRTKAVMPVHLYGQAVPMRPILDVAERYGLRVVEDACQAHGAKIDGRRAGAIGDAGCFSFYPGKNLGAYGDGGAIVTNDERLYERLLLERDFGQKKKYEHLIKGDNCRLDAIQAAVLDVKLRYLDEWNERRRDHAALYDALLAIAGFETPKNRNAEGHVYHLYVTQVRDRDRVRDELASRGIATGIHYPVPIHLQPAYADLGILPGRFPVTETAARRILSLPMYPELEANQIRYVVDTLREVAEPALRLRATVA
ncbi:MAG: DegT/DnrJ/EryC1/StrS family aminotransferase [Candidatus Eremiobacteraeota bacterium]|nr:DegT/DnrJ/EryC1/StrS family aminotransferase [Candidatus Eremiobacteraeota bacterium]